MNQEGIYMTIIILASTILPILVIGYLLPAFSRKSLIFGVSIPEEVSSSSEVKDLKALYFKYLSITNIVSIIISYFIWKLLGMELVNASMFATILLVLALTISYYLVHTKGKKLKANIGWKVGNKQIVVINTIRKESSTAFNFSWFWLPSLMVVFTILIIVIAYPTLPEQIPGNYDVEGNVTRYDEKSPFTISILPLIMLGTTVMFYFISKMIVRAKENINPRYPEISAKKNRIAKYRWIVCTLILACSMNLLFMVIQFHSFGWLGSINITPLALILSFGPILPIMYVAFTTGQSGNRVKIKEDLEIEGVMHNDDDNQWLGGLIYYNKSDPSLWVEKRFGIGWTVNAGHPIGMGICVLTVFLLVGLLIIPFIL
ncbi:MAG: DUF1648 domain-containing protein [Alkaliphilus sp.]